MEDHATRRPCAALSPYVSTYVGYRSEGVAPALHRGLPSPWVTVVLTLDDPLQVVHHADPRQPGGSYDALVGGLHTAPVLLSHDGRQSGVQLSLKPLGMRSLLGVPAGQIASLDLPAEDLLGPRVVRLRERLCLARTWEARFAVLDEVLLSWVAQQHAPRAEVVRAWQLIARSGGAARVEDVAADVGWSARHLRTRFSAEVGLAPKALARVLRFDRATRRLQADPGSALSALAVDLGYADQAHLARDFAELAGLSPTRWMRAEGLFRNVQDERAAAAAR